MHHVVLTATSHATSVFATIKSSSKLSQTRYLAWLCISFSLNNLFVCRFCQDFMPDENNPVPHTSGRCRTQDDALQLGPRKKAYVSHLPWLRFAYLIYVRCPAVYQTP